MRILILFSIWLIGNPLFAMENPPIFDSYRAEQGLSMNIVNDIVTDDRGFLWIATQAGLLRYDGKNFKVYKVDQNKGPTEKHIKKLFFGKKKQLWLLTKSDGLNLYKPKSDSFTSFNESNSPLSNTEIIDIYQDDDSNLWLATQNNGLIHYSPNENKIMNHFLPSSKDKGIISNKLTLLLADQLDRIWIVIVDPEIETVS